MDGKDPESDHQLFDMHSSSSHAYSTDTPKEILADIHSQRNISRYPATHMHMKWCIYIGVTFSDVKSKRKKVKRCGVCRNCTPNDLGTCMYSRHEKVLGPREKEEMLCLKEVLTQIHPHVPSRQNQNYPLTTKDTPDVVDQEYPYC